MTGAAVVEDASALRVGINAIALLSPRTGIGQYVYQLSREFLSMPSVSPLFFYGTKWAKELRSTPIENIDRMKSAVKSTLRCPYALLRTGLQVGFTTGLWRHTLDLYHDPNFLAYRFSGPTVITVHDLSWIRHPETHPKERIAAMERYFPRSLERASRILTDCDFVKQELIEVFGVAPARIHPVLLGVAAEFSPRPAVACAEALAAHGLEFGHYFLSVGTLEPRKNITSLIDAFSMLPEDLQRRYPLALVGMRGWLTSGIEARIRPLVDKGVVKPLGYVADEQMPMLYSGAAAFVFPSLYEGFGLPPLEAMACGTPVLASNRSSLPEVVGDAGVSLDPLDCEAWAQAMRRVIEDGDFAADLAARGVARAQGFTWRRTAEETLAVYRRAMA